MQYFINLVNHQNYENTVVKKVGIGFLVLFTLALIAAGYYLQKSKKIETVDPFLTIPADAAIIIETPDFPELLTKIEEKNGLISRLGRMAWAEHLAENAGKIDSITGKREVREYVTGRRVVISFHAGKNGKLIPLAAMNIGTGISKHRMASLVSLSGAEIVEDREISGTRVIAARYNKGKKVSQVYFAATSGVFLASPSETLIENALNNKNAGTDIRLQQGFAHVSGSFGNEHNNVFILFRNLPKFLNGLIKTDAIGEISGIAVAAGGEIDEKEEGLYISGFISTAGTGAGADKIMKIFPATPGVQEILPASTLLFRTMMGESVLTGEPATDVSAINATDIALALKPFIENEMTVATLQTTSGNKDVALFRLNNKSAAEEALNFKISGKYKSMGLKSNSYRVVTKGHNDEEVIIYKMPFTGVAQMLGQSKKLSFNDNWVLFCRSYAVFAEDPDVLIDILNANLTDATLINDAAYREVEKSLPTKSSFLFYASADAFNEIISRLLLPELAATFKSNSFAGIGAMGISLTPSNEMIYSSLSIAYGEDKKGLGQYSVTSDTARANRSPEIGSNEEILIWKTTLSAPPAIKPFIFINHNNNSKEIFIQDLSNNIYLLSASGKILWKTQIKERIWGDVFMIDYYRNGKNQLLFSGKDYLHVIDRNGGYVDRFPVKLKSPAANVLSVFDYESNKDYRLFITGEDKKVYAYDRSGFTVKGWIPYTTIEKVTAPVRYFRTGGKDYIIVNDAKNLYIFDRKGSIRVTLDQQAAIAENSSVRLTKSSRLAFAGREGEIHLLNFSGEEERKKAGGGFTSGFFFDYADIDRDGKAEYVFMDKGVLSVYREDMSEVISKKVASEKYMLPQILTLSSGTKLISVADDQQGLVYLFDGKGNPEAGFPVKGAVPPAAVKISDTSGNAVITGGPDNNVYCYKVSK